MKKLLLTFTVPLALVAGCKDQASSPPAASPAAPAAAPAAPAAEPAAAAAPAADDTKTAQEIFSTRCLPCHGANGAGDGPASAGLVPKPANFTLGEWQAKVTDDHIEKIIVFGGSAVGKAATMPPNPDLDPKPGVVKALRAHIRSLKK